MLLMCNTESALYYMEYRTQRTQNTESTGYIIHRIQNAVIHRMQKYTECRIQRMYRMETVLCVSKQNTLNYSQGVLLYLS